MGQTTLRDLRLAGQFAMNKYWGKGEIRTLREIVDVPLSGPFPIRSVEVYQDYLWQRQVIDSRFWRTYNFELCGEEVRGSFHRGSLEEDEADASAAKSFRGAFLKDLRKNRSGDPINPNTYGRWVFYDMDDEEYKRLEAEFEAFTKSKSGCFIATAVFDDADSPQVVALRTFRDEFVCRYGVGRLAARLYYRTSPPIAARLRSWPTTRVVVRHALESFVRLLPKL